jgi:MOSC domain-containing protein YiiM
MSFEPNEGGVLLSINVGRARSCELKGKPARSAIWKSPVTGQIRLADDRVAGDEQVDKEHHGGFDKAVYAYAIEDYRWWEEELGRTLEHGQFGENFTTEGVDVGGALIGERWAVGSAVLEVSEPRIPCSRLAMRMQDDRFVKRFYAALRPGCYLRIVVVGQAAPGDRVRVVARPSHGMRVADVFRIASADKHEAARLLDVPELPQAWAQWAEDELAKREPDDQSS